MELWPFYSKRSVIYVLLLERCIVIPQYYTRDPALLLEVNGAGFSVVRANETTASQLFFLFSASRRKTEFRRMLLFYNCIQVSFASMFTITRDVLI